MPYVKTPEAPFAAISRLIRGYGLTQKDMAHMLGVSRPTVKKLMDNPELFTLRDLDRLNRFGHIPLEEIRAAAVRGGQECKPRAETA